MSKTWARRAAWGAIALAVLAALVLGATIVVARRGVREAQATLVRGQGEALLRSMEDWLSERPRPPSQAAIASLLERFRDEGVRYVAIVDPRPGPLPEAGDATLGELRGSRAGALVTADGRARMVHALFPAPPGLPHHEPPPPRSPPLLVVEFVPALAATVDASMQTASVVAGVAVLMLLVLALLLARFIARSAEAERLQAHERRLLSLGQMSSVMAHELRNPLASLKGHAQLMLEECAEGSELHGRATVVVNEAQRLERLTRSLLELVREGPIDLAPVEPGALIERSLAGLSRERVQVDLQGAPAALAVDEARVASALGNLVRNALESAPEGPIEISVRTEASASLIEVRDHGPGLPKGLEERVFEPFVTTRVKGTGLGLSIARRVAEQHGGTLTADSPDGGGARFRMSLPTRPG